LFVIRVSGSSREPVPPARTTPFMPDAMLVGLRAWSPHVSTLACRGTLS